MGTLNTWLIVVAAVLGVLAIAVFIATRTSWFKVRKYAMEVKKIYDKHNVQEKTEAVQSLSQNPNPVLVKKPLRELIAAIQSQLSELDKVSVPKKAQELHDQTVTMQREQLSFFQMAMVGGFRQKAMQEKQRKMQSMEKSLRQKMEAVYGPIKEPKQKQKKK